MCGIAGFFDAEPAPEARPERLAALAAMSRQIRRRGPDDEQLFDDGQLSVAFRRLSIIDLGGGRQPIWNEDETLFVLVNGEIYNHVELRAALKQPHHFRTRSDSEIVLHLFEERGPAALELLEGMFAIAVWDAVNKRLFLARDRMGIKPMYFCEAGSRLLFGSELKALLAHPDCPSSIDWSAIDRPSPYALHTYVEKVRQLPGGHYLVCQPGRAPMLRAWWRLEDHFGEGQLANAADYRDAYVSRFEHTVQSHLMSDVMVGAFLSGGIDSSAMVGAIAKNGVQLHCFTVLESALLANGDAPSARAVADAVGVPLHPVCFADDLLDRLGFSLETLEYFVWMMDRPAFNYDWFFKHELHRYARTLFPALKVILVGQGADEFAGGYSNDALSPHAHWTGYLEGNLRALLRASHWQKLPSWMHPLLGAQPSLEPPARRGWPTFHKEMFARSFELQNTNLWLEDRVASVQSIETRVPFLDHRLVELLASVPPHLHAELFWDKNIVREAAKRWLPERLTRRQKVGFYHSPNESSLERMRRGMLLRSFPAFREKYLTAGDALFDAEKLGRLFSLIADSSTPQRGVMDTLFQCMTISIFQRLCLELRSGLEVATIDPPSRLEERDELPPGDDPEPLSWSANDRARLFPGAQLFMQLDPAAPKKRVRILRDHGSSSDLLLGTDQEWLLELLHSSCLELPPTLEELALRLELSVEELIEAATSLRDRGWLVRVV